MKDCSLPLYTDIYSLLVWSCSAPMVYVLSTRRKPYLTWVLVLLKMSFWWHSVHHVENVPIFLSSLFCLLFVRVLFIFLGWSLSIFACFLHSAYKTGQALLFSGPSVILSPMGMLRFNQPINHVASPKARSGAWVWEAASYNRSSDFFLFTLCCTVWLTDCLFEFFSLNMMFSCYLVCLPVCFLMSSF